MAPNKLTADDSADAFAFDGYDPEEAPAPVKPALPAAAGDDVPDWAVVPPNMKVPKGRQVLFLRFPPTMTDAPLKGERQCIVWSLSDGEEKIANDRTGGSSARAPAEFTKQMVRAVDGVQVDWSKAKGPGSLDEFWREIGPKSRNMLMRVYTQLHLASEEETRDFFESCVAVRTANLRATRTGALLTLTRSARHLERSPA